MERSPSGGRSGEIGVKPEYWLVMYLLGILATLGAMSFFVAPVYATGVELVMDVLKYALVSIISFLFGRSLPEQVGDPKPGQTGATTSKTETTKTAAETPNAVPAEQPK